MVKPKLIGTKAQADRQAEGIVHVISNIRIKQPIITTRVLQGCTYWFLTI